MNTNPIQFVIDIYKQSQLSERNAITKKYYLVLRLVTER